jgi:outer membrane protein
MKYSQAIFMTFLATLLSAIADPRFAMVKVREIYDKLPSTAVLEQDITRERENIMKDARADQLRTIISDLQVLQGQLTDTKKPLDQETNRKVARNYEIKRMEAQNIKQEFENYRAEQEKKINQKLVSSMKASLARILETSGQIAQEKGYETVFDSSGATNTGIGFVLYSKETPDLSADVQAKLMLTEPPMPAPKKQEPAPVVAPELPSKPAPIQ